MKTVAELLDKLKNEAGSDLMASLVIAEHDNKNLKDATAKVVSAATQVGGPVHILVAGQGLRRGR